MQVWEPATRASRSGLDLGTWIYGLAGVGTPYDIDRVLVACTGGMYPVPDFLLVKHVPRHSFCYLPQGTWEGCLRVTALLAMLILPPESVLSCQSADWRNLNQGRR